MLGSEAFKAAGDYEREFLLNENDTSREVVRALYEQIKLAIPPTEPASDYYTEAAIWKRKVASGQIVVGGGRYWFSELRWSDQAWNVIHPLVRR